MGVRPNGTVRSPATWTSSTASSSTTCPNRWASTNRPFVLTGQIRMEEEDVEWIRDGVRGQHSGLRREVPLNVESTEVTFLRWLLTQRRPRKPGDRSFRRGDWWSREE
jgi:hypothetical protein